MDALFSDVGIGIVVFATANIDDLFVLAAFFADKKMRPFSIVVGTVRRLRHIDADMRRGLVGCIGHS
jgi:cadmium resistance protein CadD (predicted permease)